MTDYVSQLLEEQEQEREQDALGVALSAGGAFLRRALTKDQRGAVGPAAGARSAAEEAEWGNGLPEAPDMRETHGGAAEALWMGRAGPEGVFFTAAPAALRKNRSAALEAQKGGRAGSEVIFAEEQSEAGEVPGRWEHDPPQWLLQAGAGVAPERETGAGWLYQRLSAGEAAAGYRGTQRSGSSFREWEEAYSPGGGLSPEELDRALERDARRYDGGFALF